MESDNGCTTVHTWPLKGVMFGAAAPGMNDKACDTAIAVSGFASMSTPAAVIRYARNGDEI
jgi:hypothetical protein